MFTHFGLTLVVALIAAFQAVGEPSFISRFKASLKPAVLYALLAAASTVCYHHVVCAENTALRMLERETFIDRSLADETAFAALQADDPQLAMMDIETARENGRKPACASSSIPFGILQPACSCGLLQPCQLSYLPHFWGNGSSHDHFGAIH